MRVLRTENSYSYSYSDLKVPITTTVATPIETEPWYAGRGRRGRRKLSTIKIILAPYQGKPHRTIQCRIVWFIRRRALSPFWTTDTWQTKPPLNHFAYIFTLTNSLYRLFLRNFNETLLIPQQQQELCSSHRWMTSTFCVILRRYKENIS